MRSQNPGFYKDAPEGEGITPSIPPPSPYPPHDHFTVPQNDSPTDPPKSTILAAEPTSNAFFSKVKSLYGASYTQPPPVVNSANFNFVDTNALVPMGGMSTIQPNTSFGGQDNRPNPDPIVPGGWQSIGGNMIYNGKVGINTNAPSESLTVNGSIFSYSFSLMILH